MSFTLFGLTVMATAATAHKLPDYIEKAIIQAEGTLFTNYKYDPGGPTKYGWTLKSYKATINPRANMETIRSLTQEDAMKYYYQYFWKLYGAYRLKNEKLATAVMLAQINLGPSRPNKLLQKMSNDFCNKYKKLPINGKLDINSAYNINNCKYLWPGYPYILYYMYKDSSHIKKVWSWAQEGLKNRIFYGLIDV